MLFSNYVYLYHTYLFPSNNVIILEYIFVPYTPIHKSHMYLCDSCCEHMKYTYYIYVFIIMYIDRWCIHVLTSLETTPTLLLLTTSLLTSSILFSSTTELTTSPIGKQLLVNVIVIASKATHKHHNFNHSCSNSYAHIRICSLWWYCYALGTYNLIRTYTVYTYIYVCTISLREILLYLLLCISITPHPHNILQIHLSAYICISFHLYKIAHILCALLYSAWNCYLLHSNYIQ